MTKLDQAGPSWTKLDVLRAKVAELKSSPIYLKPGLAEQVMDAVIAVLAEQNRDIEELKGGKNGKQQSE